MASKARILATLAFAGLVAACGGGDPDLRTLSNDGDGPDEFSIVPNRPLEQPRDLAALPAPTPGGANRSDQDPLADATRALGGTPGGATAPVQGEALIAATGRFGTDPGVRAELAARDRAFREDNRGRLLNRVFRRSTYDDAYSGQSLDQYDELERLRGRGVRTPAAPPQGAR